MGFLRSLFGQKKAPQITITMSVTEGGAYTYEQSEASKLLQKATEKKQQGDLEAAIACLKEAYAEIAKGDMNYGIDPFLRLPMYLQAAGKNDEAWKEFNRLIAEGYPNQMKAKELFPMEASIIHDKMRLFLQREGKKDVAVRFGAMAHMYWAIGLHMQDRMDELKEHLSDERLRKELGSLLKRAKKEDRFEMVLGVFKSFAEKLPRVPMGDFAREIDKAVLQKSSPLKNATEK